MIYVSSCSTRSNSIKESTQTLAEAGINNIELTGGSNYYADYEKDLLDLQDKYGLNYLVHNYFPPPKQHFILNLASLDDATYEQSIEHCTKAIQACKRFKSKKYGVHAGFLIDFSTSEVGKKIGYRALNDRQKSLKRFIEAWHILTDEASSDVKLYIENNVFSKTNSKTYAGENPFLLTDYESYIELYNQMNFNLLLDLAHLKVSENSLGLDFKDEANKLIQLTDYIHVSGNDGLHDQNFGLHSDADIRSILSASNLSDKTITLEVYDGMDSILKSIETINELVL